ncbi:hypothetical protein V6N11_035421 [Hibiscus sabdariffa]|uniref:Endonuclease/exonuclease/phosphatase domain-containing protein n=1 Tax=Hibiscus sabdariffa TaxID=183260 RepID=A0ABR2R0Q2_9ROSI
MALMSWNVRGLGNKETVRALKNDAFKFHPSIIFLSETKQKRKYLEKIRRNMKMENSFYVDPLGIAGGLALWWTKEVNITILNAENNFIDAEIVYNGKEVLFATFIYGPPYVEDKQVFWDKLSTLRSNPSDKWCIIGDSSIVARQDEKIGGANFDVSQARRFFEFLEKSSVLELPIKGGNFTWSNLRSKGDAILEKLDRILANIGWSTLFPKAIGILVVAITSDHSPIFLLLKGLNKRSKKTFKFESKWLLEEDCSLNIN